MPEQQYDSIYLSPHLDDIPLSCGGQVYLETSAGRRVLVVTLVAGRPTLDRLSHYAQYLHQSWGLASDLPPTQAVAGVVNARRAEDAAACRRLGADYRHWELPDCVYRPHPETGEFMYTSNEDIFGQVHPAEAGLVSRLAAWMAALPRPGRVLVPLTLGHHVDHQLTRAAAEQCFAPALIHYYEDYPYVQWHPQQLDNLVNESEWQPEIIPLTAAARQARLEAIAAYESQLAMLFGGRAGLEAQLMAQIAATGGERVWQRAETGH